MTLQNITYNLGYPVYGAKFVNDDVLVVAGGGGRDQPGIRSKLTALRVDFGKKKPVKRFREITMDSSDDSPTTLDAARGVILVGCNEGAQKIADTGVNHHIRKYVYQNDHLQFTASIDFDSAADPDIYTKLTAISPNGAVAAIASSKTPTLIRVINPLDLSQKYEIQTGREVRDLAFSLDGQLLAYVTSSGLDVASIASGEFIMKKADFDKDLIFSKVRFIANDTILVAATFTNKPGAVLLKVKFSKKGGKVIQRGQISTRLGSITALEVDPQNKFLVLATNENSVAIFNVGNLSGIESFKNLHELLITRIAISPDSKLIATVSAGNTVNVINKFSGGSLGSIVSLLKKILINIVLVVIIAALANVAYKNDLHLKSYEFARKKYLKRREVKDIEPFENKIVTTTNIIEGDIVSISSLTKPADTYIDTGDLTVSTSSIVPSIEISTTSSNAFGINTASVLEPSGSATSESSTVSVLEHSTTVTSEVNTVSVLEPSIVPTSSTLEEPLETYSFDRHLEMPTFNEEEISMLLDISSSVETESPKDKSEQPTSHSHSIVKPISPSSALVSELSSSSSSITVVETLSASILSTGLLISTLETPVHSRIELKPLVEKDNTVELVSKLFDTAETVSKAEKLTTSSVEQTTSSTSEKSLSPDIKTESTVKHENAAVSVTKHSHATQLEPEITLEESTAIVSSHSEIETGTASKKYAPVTTVSIESTLVTNSIDMEVDLTTKTLSSITSSEMAESETSEISTTLQETAISSDEQRTSSSVMVSSSSPSVTELIKEPTTTETTKVTPLVGIFNNFKSSVLSSQPHVESTSSTASSSSSNSQAPTKSQSSSSSTSTSNSVSSTSSTSSTDPSTATSLSSTIDVMTTSTSKVPVISVSKIVSSVSELSATSMTSKSSGSVEESRSESASSKLVPALKSSKSSIITHSTTESQKTNPSIIEKTVKQKITIDGVVYVVASSEEEKEVSTSTAIIETSSTVELREAESITISGIIPREASTVKTDTSISINTPEDSVSVSSKTSTASSESSTTLKDIDPSSSQQIVPTSTEETEATTAFVTESVEHDEL